MTDLEPPNKRKKLSAEAIAQNSSKKSKVTLNGKAFASMELGNTITSLWWTILASDINYSGIFRGPAENGRI